MRNGGLWTESRFHSFVKGALRSASNRWGPKFAAKKASWIKRGVYQCAGYKIKPHEIPASFVNEKGKRVNNVCLDHVIPVVDPVKGFTTWDNLIERLFVEVSGFQVLCFECHANKTADERQVRKDSKTNE